MTPAGCYSHTVSCGFRCLPFARLLILPVRSRASALSYTAPPHGRRDLRAPVASLCSPHSVPSQRRLRSSSRRLAACSSALASTRRRSGHCCVLWGRLRSSSRWPATCGSACPSLPAPRRSGRCCVLRGRLRCSSRWPTACSSASPSLPAPAQQRWSGRCCVLCEAARASSSYSAGPPVLCLPPPAIGRDLHACCTVLTK
ncbi:hypothetical protein BS78_K017200 [Paspalum vaginatum]|uniref:Uncharacterized protein n=1 Tax=Paspalum vaginatum TaxID=158149 RepID=A0A9W7XFN8_9POAL|nr:hypothetical protein BS78_K017200 [Paspalum vaginatum]